jgi:hypothetical protein
MFESVCVCMCEREREGVDEVSCFFWLFSAQYFLLRQGSVNERLYEANCVPCLLFLYLCLLLSLFITLVCHIYEREA